MGKIEEKSIDIKGRGNKSIFFCALKTIEEYEEYERIILETR